MKPRIDTKQFSDATQRMAQTLGASFIAFTPDTRPKCPVCGALGVVSVERGGGDPAYTLYYCSAQRHPYYLPQ